MTFPTLRDYREPRDWRRPWADAPGWFPCCCNPSAQFSIFGGIAGSGTIATTDTYDTGANSWTNMTDMVTARYGMFSCGLASNYYACGNVGGGSSANEQYDSAGDSWSTKTAQATPARGSVNGAGIATGKFYDIAGNGGIFFYRDIDEYDESGDSWSAKTDLVTPGRDSHSIFNISGTAYSCGGRPSFAGAYMRDTDSYDTAGDSSANKSDMPTPARTSAAPMSISSLGYLAGGHDSLTTISDCDEYDPSGDSWASKTNISSPSRYAAAGASPSTTGSGFSCAGINSSGTRIADCDEYTPDTWSSKTDMDFARNSSGAGFQ